MKIQVKSDKSRSVTTSYRTVKLKVDNFTIIQEYVDGVLHSQAWKLPRKSHPTAYEPSKLYFAYYEDISFLTSDSNSNYMDFYNKIPDSSLIANWDDFKGLDHVLCVHLGMDGCIYRIDRSDPISLWRHMDYISGFRSGEYDLKKVASILKKKSWIRNIEEVEIPWYNKDPYNYAIEFDYKLPSKKDLAKKLKKDFPNHYFG